MKSTLLKVVVSSPLAVALAFAQGSTHHVSANVPVIGPRVTFGADRSVPGTSAMKVDKVSPAANKWTLEATLPGAVIHDISFVSPKVGYAAAELGQVWKTTDGGQHWTEIMNLNFPYYWYGVDAVTARDVIISGFNDSTFQGIARWSHDGGVTWTPDIVLTSRGWSYRVRFESNGHDGVVMDGLNLDAPNASHYTGRRRNWRRLDRRCSRSEWWLVRKPVQPVIQRTCAGVRHHLLHQSRPWSRMAMRSSGRLHLRRTRFLRD